MNLRQVEIFCAVMRCRTTVAAAFELGITQPAVSAAIKHMEVQLGLKLFERIGNRLVPTHEATMLHRDTKPMQAMSQALAVKVRDLRYGRRGHLRVLSTLSMARSIAGQALARFLAKRPDVHVFFDTMRTEEIVEMIDSGFADLGMTLAPTPRPGLRIETITSVAMVVALPQDHRLARRTALTPDDLKDERLIGIETVAQLGELVRQAFESANALYRPSVEVRHGTTACMLVERGLGVAVVDPFSAWEEAGWQIETRPFLPRIELQACAMSLQAQPMSRLATQFLAELHASAPSAGRDAASQAASRGRAQQKRPH